MNNRIGRVYVTFIFLTILVGLLSSHDYALRRYPSVLRQTNAVQAYVVKSGFYSDVWRIVYVNGDQELVECEGFGEYVCQ